MRSRLSRRTLRLGKGGCMSRLWRSLYHSLLMSSFLIILFVSYYSKLEAQEYLFSVPRLEMDVRIQKDASAIIEYDIDFENAPGAHAIDIVDIGLPHGRYKIMNMNGSLDGKAARQIRAS